MIATALVLWMAAAPAAPAYDPTQVAAIDVRSWDGRVADAERHRDIPVRVYLPDSAKPAPVILYSHGLGGSIETSRFLGEHWAKRGFVAVFMQHPGSDDSVWKDAKPGERMAALERAASVDQFLARVADVSSVLDTLARWNADAKHPLAGRLDLAKVGMSGHSFGAVTTEAVSGEALPRGHDFTDHRIRAALVMSPSTPHGLTPEQAFGKVALPWLLMTGTKDEAPIGHQTAASRLEVFRALPAGAKYQLVLDGAEHSVFTDRALPGDTQPRNPAHHPAIAAISTAFFDAYLDGDAAARAWLDGDGPRKLLAPADRWEKK